MNYKVGDFVCITLGLEHDRMEIVEIIDEEIITEIGVHDYFVRTQGGAVFGPYHSHSFLPITNPNTIIKDIV